MGPLIIKKGGMSRRILCRGGGFEAKPPRMDRHTGKTVVTVWFARGSLNCDVSFMEPFAKGCMETEGEASRKR